MPGASPTLRRIASLADLYQVRTGCHGATDLSPVSMAAALHFGLSIPNFGIQEYMRHTPETDAVFPHAYRFADGTMHPGDAPGLGVDIDEDLAAAHPYARAVPASEPAGGRYDVELVMRALALTALAGSTVIGVATLASAQEVARIAPPPAAEQVPRARGGPRRLSLRRHIMGE